jgi:hypothetical protein
VPAARACWPFLFQGRDVLQFLLRPGLLPISKEFSPMESGPFNHESQGARRQLAGEDGQAPDIDQHEVATVFSVEVQ